MAIIGFVLWIVRGQCLHGESRIRRRTRKIKKKKSMNRRKKEKEKKWTRAFELRWFGIDSWAFDFFFSRTSKMNGLSPPPSAPAHLNFAIVNNNVGRANWCVFLNNILYDFCTEFDLGPHQGVFPVNHWILLHHHSFHLHPRAAEHWTVWFYRENVIDTLNRRWNEQCGEWRIGVQWAKQHVRMMMGTR